MFDWLNYIGNERGKELARESEHEYLIRLALSSQEKPAPFYYTALAKFGQQLSTWGHDLQERYGDIEQMTMERAAHEQI